MKTANLGKDLGTPFMQVTEDTEVAFRIPWICILINLSQDRGEEMDSSSTKMVASQKLQLRQSR